MSKFGEQTDHRSLADGLLECRQLSEIAYGILVDGRRFFEFNGIKNAILFDYDVNLLGIAFLVAVVLDGWLLSGMGIAFQDLRKAP